MTKSKRLTGEQLFRHRLALALGCTVRELISRMNSAELADWREYFVEEPWGTPVEDHRFATVISVMLKIMGSKSHITTADLFPRGIDGAREHDAKRKSADQELLMAEQLKVALMMHDASLASQPEKVASS